VGRALLDRETDPAAVVPRRGQRQPAPPGRRVLAHHPPAGPEPARRHHHPPPRAHPQRPAIPLLQLDHRAVQHPAQPGRVQIGLHRPAMQPPVREPDPGRGGAQRQASHPRHPAALAALAAFQPGDPGLPQHPAARRPHRLGQPRVQHAARGTPSPGAVPARRRPCRATSRQLAARVVQVVPVGRVGGLVRAQAALERHPVSLQPGQHLPAAHAELPQRGRRHHVPDLRAQVVQHRLRRVTHPRRQLLRRPAPRVDHPARKRRRPAALEPVDDQHVRRRSRRLKRRAGPGRPEPHHHHVGLKVPVVSRHFAASAHLSRSPASCCYQPPVMIPEDLGPLAAQILRDHEPASHQPPDRPASCCYQRSP
jgi:hypothetical protein